MQDPKIARVYFLMTFQVSGVAQYLHMLVRAQG